MDTMAPPDGSQRRGLVMPTGGLGGLLGLGAQDAGVASRLTCTSACAPSLRLPATQRQCPCWAYAVDQVQTDTAAHYRGFFTPVGAAGWELGGQAGYANPGSQTAATLLVTVKRSH